MQIFKSPQKMSLKLLKPLIMTGFAVVIGFIISGLKLHSIEAYLYDLRFRLIPTATSSNQIVTILIDKDTIQKINHLPDLADHTELLKKIQLGSPIATVYVHPIKNLKGTSQDKIKFVQESKKLAHFYQLTNELVMKGEGQLPLLPDELAEIQSLSGPPTADKKSFAQDGVTRRMMHNYQGQPMIHPYLAQLVNPEVSDKQKIKGLFPWIDSDQIFIHFQKPSAFQSFKFEQILAVDFDFSVFKDKIVLIGEDLQQDPNDYFQTPYSREISAMTAVDLHAQMLDTLIRNDGIRKAPDWLNYTLTILIAVLTIHVVLSLKPLIGILILLGSAFGFTLISFLAFWLNGFWIDMTHPFLAIFLCYYFLIPYRLIVENRRSWEYYQKHKLLSELETLKTNFIGMMSHDLKTPLARIQGMTEVISQDNSPLSSPQREALDTIKQSSEDLLKFISTILNYAQIESHGVQLHMQAKDINQLLKEVAKKYEFLAKLKHIQIVLELEPLFSLQVDPELLKQVFSNLIENAIKYSPENSKVLISSEEINNQIVIQVADQGPGIPAEEIPNIFMKFFRSQKAKSSPIKGSGLGLYLARYFVELHGGRIHCESTINQGSTFTVELPLK